MNVINKIIKDNYKINEIKETAKDNIRQEENSFNQLFFTTHSINLAMLLDNDQLYLGAHGFKDLIPEKTPINNDTLYDLASLTKVVVTVPLILKTIEKGIFVTFYKMVFLQVHIFQHLALLDKEDQVFLQLYHMLHQ